MLKIAAPVWLILGTVLAGVAVTAGLSVPSLSGSSQDMMKFIPIAAVVGYIVAIPFAAVIARKIASLSN